MKLIKEIREYIPCAAYRTEHICMFAADTPASFLTDLYKHQDNTWVFPATADDRLPVIQAAIYQLAMKTFKY